MKIKHVILFVFLILIIGGIFYAGWIQIHLDENTYAVAYTKSNGYLKEVYSPGKFSWSVYRLIPGNFKLIKFLVKPQIRKDSMSGILPSGKVYGKFLPGQPDFSFKLDYSISFSIKPDKLPELVSTGSLTPHNLMEMYAQTADSIKVNIRNLLFQKVSDSGNKGDDLFFTNSFSDSVKLMVKNKFTNFILLNFSPFEITIPDLKLYKKARDTYFAFLDSRSNSEITDSQKKVETELREKLKIELLKKYGELLKQYPELVQLLASDSKLRNQVLPKIDLSTGESHE